MFDDSDPQADEDLYELLANPRRRYLLQRLASNSGDVDLERLSREIARHDIETPGDVDEETVTSVYVSLYQTHLPALEEGDVVAFDPDDGTVRLDGRTDELAAILREPSDPRRPWGVYYLCAALVLSVPIVVGASRVVRVPTILFSVVALLGVAVLVVFLSGQLYETVAGSARLDELF